MQIKANNGAALLTISEHRPCPVCGGDSTRPLFRQTFQAVDQIGLLDGYDVVACQRCGTTFADLIPRQSQFDQYYRDLSKYAYEHRGGKESPDDEWRLRQVANTLQSLIPSRSTRILEIGCANGSLLGILKAAGYQNVFGLDPSPDCAEAALNRYGVRVLTGSVFAMPLVQAGYDFLVLLGVLEHIRDVSLAAQTIRGLLTASGHVYVEVPDATNLIAECDAPFQEFSMEHINFFSPTALRFFMESAGFQTIEAKSVVRPARTGKPSAVVSGFFENSGARRTSFARDFEAEAGLQRYISKCRGMDADLRRRIDEAVSKHRNFIVWGVGTHTQRLLATGALNVANIVAFADSNPKYQNHQLRGIPVLRPEALKNCVEPILISSCAFQQEIADQIRGLNLPNELILLYETDSVVRERSGLNGRQ
ncbi:MAG: class I SAM-dependent methyltransferase [Candidatus Acidiferrum sp.]